MCPTVEKAQKECEQLLKMYPSFWVLKRKHPPTLISPTGNEYIFRGETEGQRAIRGSRAGIVTIDEFLWSEGEVANGK